MLQKNDSMFAQYYGSVSEIKYTKNELKEIFIRNIKDEQKSRLVYKSLLESNPFKAFTGHDIIKNKISATDNNEKIFDYIYRHTFARPRDLMMIGESISNLPITEKQQIDQLKLAINNTAKKIGEQYIKEIEPFVPQIDFKKIYTLIEKNVLSKNEVKQICCDYNNSEDCDCNDENKIHLFCLLYTQGLIGVEDLDIVNNKLTQKFLRAGEHPVYDFEYELPDSQKYFIHPCFSEVIDDYRNSPKNKLKKFKYYDIIIGYDYELKKKSKNKIKSLGEPKIHIHFGLGKLGGGLVIKHFKNKKIIIIQRSNDKYNNLQNDATITLINRIKNNQDNELEREKIIELLVEKNNLDNKKLTDNHNYLFITNDPDKIKDLIQKADSISSSIGGHNLKYLTRYFKDIELNEDINFYPFENDHSKVKDFFKEINNKNIIYVGIMADRICKKINFIRDEIIVDVEPYEETIVEKTNQKVLSDFENSITNRQAIIADDKGFKFLKNRKYYLVNGLHTIITIEIYYDLYKRGIELEQMETIPIGTLFTNKEILDVFDDIKELQILRLLIEEKKTKDTQLKKELANYAEKVKERFIDNSQDQLGRILSLSISDLKKRREKVADRFLKLIDIAAIEKEELLEAINLEENDINKAHSKLDKLIETLLKVNKKWIEFLMFEIRTLNTKLEECGCDAS